MDIKSLNNLKINNGIYDLYTDVIIDNKKIGIFKFPCTDRHNMRIDLVCLDIYNHLNHIDILSNINNIINVLTIQSDDIIYFIDENDTDSVRSDSAVINAIIDAVKNANKGKQQKIDSNRLNDISNRTKTENNKKFIPPHILQDVNNANIDVSEGEIILRPNF